MRIPVVLEPDVVVRADGTIHRGARVRVEEGRVTACRVDAPTHGAVRVPLPGRALLPGFVNAHSHAFQRGLRGVVERRDPARPHDDFWSWRELMYALADGLVLDELEAIATLAYREMVAAGFTTVVEFHYLHHVRDAASPVDGVRALARAARAAGLRLVVLATGYERAGPGRARLPTQDRFAFPSTDALLAHARALREAVPDVGHGLALHSVRALSRESLTAIAAAAHDDGVPLHVHAAEQRAELATCAAEHGMSPIALLDEVGALAPRTTVVHATHVSDDDVQRLARRGATVCICPTTERNLGDGLAPIASFVDAGVPLAVGTDSHARIDALEELRALEDHERLRTERRAVLIRPGGTLAGALLPAATTGGARAAGRDGGDIDDGAPADLVTLRLPADACDDQSAVDAALLAGQRDDIVDVWVGGDRVKGAGARAPDDVAARARRAVARLAG